MQYVDCIIDLEQLEGVVVPEGMQLQLCTIPAGATIISVGPEADGKYHIRYSFDAGQYCTVSISTI